MKGKGFEPINNRPVLEHENREGDEENKRGWNEWQWEKYIRSYAGG